MTPTLRDLNTAEGARMGMDFGLPSHDIGTAGTSTFKLAPDTREGGTSARDSGSSSQYSDPARTGTGAFGDDRPRSGDDTNYTFKRSVSLTHPPLPARESVHAQTKLLPEPREVAKDVSLIELPLKRASGIIDALPIPGAKSGIIAALYVIKDIFGVSRNQAMLEELVEHVKFLSALLEPITKMDRLDLPPELEVNVWKLNVELNDISSKVKWMSSSTAHRRLVPADPSKLEDDFRIFTSSLGGVLRDFQDGSLGNQNPTTSAVSDRRDLVTAPVMSLPRAHYARHDSGREDAPISCLEGTREAVLAGIMSWAESTTGKMPLVYWLDGLAGTGKSSIAKTICERGEGIGMLGASFFFSRSDGPLRDPQLVFPTLAYQLALSDNALKDVIVEAIEQDPTLAYKNLLAQFQGLILTPLLKINPRRRTTLIVLDALDECEESGAAAILRILFSHATRIPFLRILITSRPEPHISSVFGEGLNHAKRVLHDIETSVIQQDIRSYLHVELAKIPRKLGLRMDSNWASENEINGLVERSRGLFIYASTCIRFIGDNRARDPRQHIRLILDPRSAHEVGATPYVPLDNLYLGVLRNYLSASDRRAVVERFQVVVGSIILLREPLPLRSLAGFVQYEMDEIDTALYHLRSVIIPPSNDDEAPRIYHPSFCDFITDASRCSETDFVIIPVPEQERRHAIRCFELMTRFLKRDVAGISDSSLLNIEVDEFEQKVRDALSPEAQYACRYWASHLSHVEFGDRVMMQMLKEFSMRSILWWFEAMSLMGSVSTAVSCIQEAHRWAMRSKCELTLVAMLSDAHRFILAHGEVIRASALHVYESALPFTPRNTVLYKTYRKEADHSIRVLQGMESQWSRTLSSLLGHSGSVNSVAYSPDALRLASGSEDHSVRLWDAMSGESIATLEGHSGAVCSVAYSPDALRLASGSEDHSVRLWDAMSGESIATLEGHSGAVRSVAFSPDALRLASGSEDHSVRLWDAMSGEFIAALEGHFGAVRSVAFSPDALRLASGSEDYSVRLWDAVTGAPIATLEGHHGAVCSVAFSPDALRLASGSEDHSVRLWDGMSGAPIATLEGHHGAVRSVAFSPDALRLASASEDYSVRLWDATSGELTATLEDHYRAVRTATFSPDGLQLVSGSEDQSVRLWDAMSGAPIATLEGHRGAVRSIAFSPEGLRLASGSEDHSMRLWDAMSGEPIATLEGHHGAVRSVAFSPDGLQLASGSEDYSVRLWDAMLGMPIATLEGHSGAVCSVAFSPDTLRLASGSEDHSVRLWDATLGIPIAVLTGHSGSVRSVAFSPDGSQLASASEDHSVRLWDAKSGMSTVTLEGYSGQVSSVAFSVDAQTLILKTRTETFAWDLTPPPPHHKDSESSAAPDAPLGVPQFIWSRTGPWIQVQRPPGDHVRRICCLPPFYSPNTAVEVMSSPVLHQIAIGCEDGRLIILDIRRHPLVGI